MRLLFCYMLLHHGYQRCKWVISCVLRVLSVKVIIVLRGIIYRCLHCTRGLLICSFVKSEEKRTALIMLWVLPRALILNLILRALIYAFAAFANIRSDLLVRMRENIQLQSHCWTNPFCLLFIFRLNKVILVCRWRILKRVSLILTNVLIIGCSIYSTFNMVVVSEVVWRALKCIDVWHTFWRNSHAWRASHLWSAIDSSNYLVWSSLVLGMSVVIAKVIALWFIFSFSNSFKRCLIIFLDKLWL